MTAKGWSSTDLRNRWVETVQAIWDHFVDHYGAARMAKHWQGHDPARLKHRWAWELRHLQPHQIQYVLDNLPDFPPTYSEFRAIAYRCPKPQLTLLEHKTTVEDKRIAREKLRSVREKIFGSAI